MRLLATLLLVTTILGCSSPKVNKPDGPKTKPKNPNLTNGAKSQYPEIARVFQNRVSPTVVDEKNFDKKQKEEWRRFTKGLSLCDGAFKIEVEKVEPLVKEDNWKVFYKIVESYKNQKPYLEQAKMNELEILHPNSAFNMPKDTLPGQNFILLVKVGDQQKMGDGIYYSIWWQLYPLTEPVLREIAKKK